MSWVMIAISGESGQKSARLWRQLLRAPWSRAIKHSRAPTEEKVRLSDKDIRQHVDAGLEELKRRLQGQLGRDIQLEIDAIRRERTKREDERTDDA